MRQGTRWLGALLLSVLLTAGGAALALEKPTVQGGTWGNLPDSKYGTSETYATVVVGHVPEDADIAVEEDAFAKVAEYYWFDYDSESQAATLYFEPVQTGSVTGAIWINDEELSVTVTVVQLHLTRDVRAIGKGDSYRAKVSGETGDADIVWRSEDPSIAKVSKNGTVTGTGYGDTTVTANIEGIALDLCASVTYPKAAKAVNKARSAVGAKYSQSRRMEKGYYDCSSLVWRCYEPYGKNFGSSKTAPTAAAEAKWLNDRNYTIAKRSMDVSRLRAGDLIFYTNGTDNGRYRSISHVSIYAGWGVMIEATNSGVRESFYREDYGNSSTNIVLIGRPFASLKNGMLRPIVRTLRVKSDGCVYLSWGRVYGAKGYWVERRLSGSDTWKTVRLSGAGSTSWTDTGVKAGKRYSYRICAYRSAKQKSNYSSVKSITVPVPAENAQEEIVVTAETA